MRKFNRNRRTLKERIFPKSNSFWWDSSWNGIIGPGGHTNYYFKNGSLALVIAIIGLVLIIGYIIFDILI